MNMYVRESRGMKVTWCLANHVINRLTCSAAAVDEFQIGGWDQGPRLQVVRFVEWYPQSFWVVFLHGPLRRRRGQRLGSVLTGRGLPVHGVLPCVGECSLGHGTRIRAVAGTVAVRLVAAQPVLDGCQLQVGHQSSPRVGALGVRGLWVILAPGDGGGPCCCC